MFQEIPGNFVLLMHAGVFRQAAVARCTLNEKVYAKFGSGYIRLGTGDATSKPKVSRVCDYSEAPNVVVRDKLKGPEFVFKATRGAA